MIYELYRKAGELHGHYCPGLAIGVRAAAEALRILEVEDIHSKSLYCIAESRACYQDGIQVVFGTTLGNGTLELRDRGKTAFNFYDREKGRGVRLVLKSQPEGMSREESTEFILTAPFDSCGSATVKSSVLTAWRNHKNRQKQVPPDLIRSGGTCFMCVVNRNGMITSRLFSEVLL